MTPTIYNPEQVGQEEPLFLKLEADDNDVDIKLVNRHGTDYRTIAYFDADDGTLTLCTCSPELLRRAGLTPYIQQNNPKRARLLLHIKESERY